MTSLLAVALTYLAIVSTYIPYIAAELGSSEDAVGAVAILAIAIAAPFLAGFDNIIGLLIIAFALWQAWSMNRPVPIVVSGPFEAVGSPNPNPPG